MRFIVDTELLKKEPLGLAGSLFLISWALGNKIDEKECYQLLFDNGYVLQDRNNAGNLFYSLRQDGVEEAERLLSLVVNDDNNNPNDRFIHLAEKLRELFPKGKKPGTYNQWRDSTSIVAIRLKTLVVKYGANFTDEEAINATKNYVASFNGDYTYMHTLKYFLYKNINKGAGVEQNSEFLSYLDNYRETGGKEEPTETDWTSELR